ncbi:glycosyltransferase family 2 protein [Pajaroellobacter abortibovis]|uniref:Glycosyltransferase 2-like domain-containing protein n=1 Tax=Pajaroellobacter abortibovis TaxID=1882918 RepID=A0A1L6MYN9_9BACT|nr:glycosyltransferase family 2 protein [Pajaroellobacter abortibovis]APS00589.1 hypothetical protein BCY86_07815 [Pajaroellobacter abortibovis]
MIKEFSIVIPTYNMSSFLPKLYESLTEGGLTTAAHEIIFVNDGSTDNTGEVLHTLQSQEDPNNRRIRPLHLKTNQGRFHARLMGARAATSPHLFFLDSRLTLASDFLPHFLNAIAHYPIFVANIQINIHRNLFCLYWVRSHEFIFRNHFQHLSQPITLTPENYDRFLKGTAALFCPRNAFLASCDHFKETNLLSDDTFLLRHMVQKHPITIDPRVQLYWVPRESTWPFLLHLIERGPFFVEYHIFARKGLFFWIVMGGLGCLIGWFLLLPFKPALATSILWIAMVVLLGSTALFAKSPREFFLLLLLHTSVVIAFGVGVLKGLVVNTIRWFQKKIPSLS